MDLNNYNETKEVCDVHSNACLKISLETCIKARGR